MFSFGSGSVYAVPSTANATPVQFGTLQDVSVDFSFSNKELTGQFQFPVAVARGPGKVGCKAKTASISALAFNTIFFGNTQTTGGLTTIVQTTAIPATPFQITVTNTATFVDDLGVTFAATGIALTKVASGPTTGQYSVSGVGLYTFAAADTTLSVNINYSYSILTGFQSTITNQLMGQAPTFQVVLNNANYGAQNFTLKLYACVSNKLAMNFKNSDFMVPEFDFEAFANTANNIGQLSCAA